MSEVRGLIAFYLLNDLLRFRCNQLERFQACSSELSGMAESDVQNLEAITIPQVEKVTGKFS